jgi:hypothetical protein
MGAEFLGKMIFSLCFLCLFVANHHYFLQNNLEQNDFFFTVASCLRSWCWKNMHKKQENDG